MATSGGTLAGCVSYTPHGVNCQKAGLCSLRASFGHPAQPLTPSKLASQALCATGAHALGSLATTLNAQENGCVGSLLALSVVTLLSMFSAGRIVWRGLF